MNIEHTTSNAQHRTGNRKAVRRAEGNGELANWEVRSLEIMKIPRNFEKPLPSPTQSDQIKPKKDFIAIGTEDAEDYESIARFGVHL